MEKILAIEERDQESSQASHEDEESHQEEQESESSEDVELVPEDDPQDRILYVQGLSENDYFQYEEEKQSESSR